VSKLKFSQVVKEPKRALIFLLVAFTMGGVINFVKKCDFSLSFPRDLPVGIDGSRIGLTDSAARGPLGTSNRLLLSKETLVQNLSSAQNSFSKIHVYFSGRFSRRGGKRWLG
jgi:hypothetical protein